MRYLSFNERSLVSGGHECYCGYHVYYRLGDGVKLMREVKYTEKEKCFAECKKLICEEKAFDHTRGWFGDFQFYIEGHMTRSSGDSGECYKQS